MYRSSIGPLTSKVSFFLLFLNTYFCCYTVMKDPFIKCSMREYLLLYLELSTRRSTMSISLLDVLVESVYSTIRRFPLKHLMLFFYIFIFYECVLMFYLFCLFV